MKSIKDLENNNNLPDHLMYAKYAGHIVWICLDCQFKGIGGPVSYHAIFHPSHRMINDDRFCKLEEKEK